MPSDDSTTARARLGTEADLAEIRQLIASEEKTDPGFRAPSEKRGAGRDAGS